MSGADALPYPPDEPGAVTAAATRCDRVAAVAGRVGEDLADDTSRLAGAWDGPAARGCREEMRRATRLVRLLVDPLRGSAAQLREHAEVLSQARSQVDALRREYDALVAAQRRQLTGRWPDTDLAGPVRRRQLEETEAAQRDELAAVHRRHQAVLDRVAEHARQTGRRLRAAAAAAVPGPREGGRPVGAHESELAAFLPLLAGARRAAGVGAGPPRPGTAPELVRQWWAALTSDEQERAVDSWATELGALDGLSAAVRSAANEHRLAHDLVMLQRRRALTDDERRWLESCLLVQAQLDQVRGEDDPFSLEPMTAQLLVFDPTAFGYDGRAAIAVGDVDAADNVAFLVPGLGSEVRATMAGLTGNALRVTTEARRLSPSTTTATVAWMGYDAPELPGGALDGSAEAGADLLAADVLAVQASRDVAPHLTVVGHSYGSTTTGTALRDHETGADDVVLVGSPGSNVESASDLGVPHGHVFVGASSRDPVSYFDRFGKDPTHESFGAIRFEAEDATRNSWRVDLDDHSKYFNAGTESLANIVHVVAGGYAGVGQAPYREELFLRPDGINSDPETDREPTTLP